MSETIGAVPTTGSSTSDSTTSSDDAELIQAFNKAAASAALSLTQSFLGDTIDAIQDTSSDPDGG